MPHPLQIVQACNNRLRQELGVSPSGLPRFVWAHSEDQAFYHPVRAVDQWGNLVFDFQCICGINIHPDRYPAEGERDEDGDLVKPEIYHKPECKGSLAIPRYRLDNLTRRPQYKDENEETIRDRWLLWTWKAPRFKTREQWDQVYGSRLDYERYKRGGYEPCSAKGPQGVNITLVVPEGKLPDMDFTNLCIEAWKIREANRALTRPVSEMDQYLMDQAASKARVAGLKEKMIEGAFVMGDLPGKKGSTSFPTPKRLRPSRLVQ